jgi:hypothetical protein
VIDVVMAPSLPKVLARVFIKQQLAKAQVFASYNVNLRAYGF